MFDQLRAAIRSKRLTPEEIDDLLREASEIEKADTRERLRNSLYEFIKYFWHVLEPDTKFVGGWPLEAMCLHLEAITKGQIKRLLINIPPGSAKSLVSNVFWPAWEWCQGGALTGMRYLCFSYAQHLTIRDNGGQEGRLSRILCSVEYQALFSGVFKITTNQATKIANDRTGWKIASSIGGIGTGERGHRVILDDPHNVREGESEVVRTMTVEWFANAMSNRLNSMHESVIVVIAQRVHEADVSGYILEKELPYEHLCIPAYSEFGRRCATSIGWVDPRVDENINFWPERYPEDSLDQLKATMLPFAWSSQYQQTPVVRGGGLFKVEWWVPWDPQEARKWGVKYPSYPRFDMVIAAVDGAYTDDTKNDPSAMTVWGVWNVPGRPTGVMLLAAWQAHLEFHQLLTRVAETASLWKLDKLLVEGKATGKSIVQELMRVYNNAPWESRWDKRGIMGPDGQYRPLLASREGWEMPTEGSPEYPTSWAATSWSVEEIDVRGRLAHGVRNDKLSRATSVAGLWFEGIVHAPMIRLKDADGDYTGEYNWATYAQTLINQMAVFPYGAHDDLSDTAVIALRWLRDLGYIKSGREATYAYRLENQSHRQLSLPPIYPT